MLDPGTLGGGSSEAFGMNNANFVVGRSDRNSLGTRAFVWDGNQMRDLNDLLVNGAGWTLVDARDINDSGQITGYGTFNGQTRAFLLNPVSDVPEPSAWAPALAGLAAIATLRAKGEKLVA